METSSCRQSETVSRHPVTDRLPRVRGERRTCALRDAGGRLRHTGLDIWRRRTKYSVNITLCASVTWPVAAQRNSGAPPLLPWVQLYRMNPSRLWLSSTMLAVCLTAAGATKAASLLPQSDGLRRVYIDAGANWANTLRLYRDIEPTASRAPWEIYAFEASPLITPFLERYCTWLNGGGIGVAPSSCLPQSGSTAHLFRYAGSVGCPASRECMWSFFAKPLAALAPDPRVPSTW